MYIIVHAPNVFFSILMEILYLIKLKNVISSAYWNTLVKQERNDRLLIWIYVKDILYYIYQSRVNSDKNWWNMKQ